MHVVKFPKNPLKKIRKKKKITLLLGASKYIMVPVQAHCSGMEPGFKVQLGLEDIYSLDRNS